MNSYSFPAGRNIEGGHFLILSTAKTSLRTGRVQIYLAVVVSIAILGILSDTIDENTFCVKTKRKNVFPVAKKEHIILSDYSACNVQWSDSGQCYNEKHGLTTRDHLKNMSLKLVDN